MPADITVTLHGSITLLHPQHELAAAWLMENVQADAQYFGNALVVEPRYVDDLIDGLVEAGFTVE